MKDVLSIWVIYDHPSDYPDSFIARRYFSYYEIQEPTMDVIVAPDYEYIRNALEKYGLVKLDRHPNDDPKIMEIWI